MSARTVWFLCCVVVCFAQSGCRKPKHAAEKSAVPEGMVLVPAGEFIMGRDNGADDERPMRRVYLDAFYIDRTEVTNAQFKTFCDSTRRLPPNNPFWDPDYFGKPDHPVVNITWEQADAYCKWAGKKLPTEAQWEKAARGSEGWLYPWGNEYFEGRGNVARGDSFRRTAPVGSFPQGVSPYGALDMVGNVWEWCADWFGETYYENAPTRNPTGPKEPSPWRVVRGGGFSSPPSDAITANRSKYKPREVLHHLGCRCVLEP